MQSPSPPQAESGGLIISLEAYEREIARLERDAMMREVERDRQAVHNRCQSFAEFVRQAWKIIEPGTPLRWNWHLDAMCDHLEGISRGILKPRLIINVPPGSSKSTIVTVLWQAWEWGPLGRRHLRYVTTSFELGNVMRDTGKTRDLIKSEWFQSMWPETQLKTEGVKSFSNFDTGTRTGVAFGSVTGKRGDRLLVDDPHSLKGAESEVQRKSTTQLFIEGGLNRTNDWETSAIVVVMQRLHEDDLTGVLLARDFGFVHLMIPMEFETARCCQTPLQVPDGAGGTRDWTDPRSYEGELMDQGRVPPEAVAQQKKAGEYPWAGQYQQRPAPREGGLFKVDLIQIVESCPGGGETVAGWDFAGSKRKTSPYSVRVLMTRVGGDVYIRHVKRLRTTPTELERMLTATSIDDRNEVPDVIISLPQDPGQAGKAQKFRFAELLSGFVFEITPETGDKVTRADPFAAQVGAERVFIVRGAWNAEYLEELRGFPSGTYKDQVDASSRAYGKIVRTPVVSSPVGPELIEADDWNQTNYASKEEFDLVMEYGDGGADPWGGL